MNFTMKILAVSVLLVAMMALALGTEAPPEAETTPGTEGPVLETSSTESETKEKEEKRVVKRSVCPFGWTTNGQNCYRYFLHPKTWAEAQKHCQFLGGNLASVHNKDEDTQFRNLAHQNPAWIGFSDCQQDGHWFWIDGTHFNYNNWCSGEPNNYQGKQHCAVINWTGLKCWDDAYCTDHQPYICARTPR